MIRLIVTDMDGTLLHDDKTMPKGIPSLIQRLRQNGIAFAAGSGRQYASLRESFAPCQEQMYFIAENGAICVDGICQTVLSAYPLPHSDVVRFIEAARALPQTNIVLCAQNCAYHEVETKQMMRHIAPYYHRHQKVADLTKVQDAILKIALLNERGTHAHVYPHFTAYQDRFHIAISAFEWMDIMPLGIHKGLGVQTLQRHLGVTADETMVFGDFMNDYEMLREATFSFAMKNALPQIKEISRFETRYDNENDGVPREICRWLADQQRLVREYLDGRSKKKQTI